MSFVVGPFLFACYRDSDLLMASFMDRLIQKYGYYIDPVEVKGRLNGIDSIQSLFEGVWCIQYNAQYCGYFYLEKDNQVVRLFYCLKEQEEVLQEVFLEEMTKYLWRYDKAIKEIIIPVGKTDIGSMRVAEKAGYYFDESFLLKERQYYWFSKQNPWNLE